MFYLKDMGTFRHKRWCTAIVLLAVCALTLSVTTRYGTSQAAPDRTQITVTTIHAWTPGLQRLLNNASTWIPPVIVAVILQNPGYYPHIAPTIPTVSGVLLEKNLYNRPPPAFSLS